MSLDNKLKERLLTEIAVSFPFAYKEVEFVYNAIKSIDATIQICEVAVNKGFASPVTIVNLLSNEDRFGSLPHNVDLLNIWPVKE